MFMFTVHLLFLHHLNTIAATPTTTSTPHEKMFKWLKSQGAYLHPQLIYQNQGMFATNHIPANTLVASLPLSLEFARHDLSYSTFIDHFVSSRNDPNHFHQPYFQALPTSCQSFLCNPPLAENFTVAGAQRVFNLVKSNQKMNPDLIASSIVSSRQWASGMRPMLDLFNHDFHLGDRILDTPDAYTLKTKDSVNAGDQVYWSYLDINQKSGLAFDFYMTYGILPKEIEFDCADMLLLRDGGNIVERMNCIASATDSTVQSMADEIYAASMVVPMDVIMLKGASQWLIRHVKTKECAGEFVDVTVKFMAQVIWEAAQVGKVENKEVVEKIDFARIRRAAQWIDNALALEKDLQHVVSVNVNGIQQIMRFKEHDNYQLVAMLFAVENDLESFEGLCKLNVHDESPLMCIVGSLVTEMTKVVGLSMAGTASTK